MLRLEQTDIEEINTVLKHLNEMFRTVTGTVDTPIHYNEKINVWLSEKIYFSDKSRVFFILENMSSQIKGDAMLRRVNITASSTMKTVKTWMKIIPPSEYDHLYLVSNTINGRCLDLLSTPEHINKVHHLNISELVMIHPYKHCMQPLDVKRINQHDAKLVGILNIKQLPKIHTNDPLVMSVVGNVDDVLQVINTNHSLDYYHITQKR